MKSKRFAGVVLAVAAFLAYITLAGVGVGMTAVPQGSHKVISNCSSDWYVNGDEADLLPKQVPLGFWFEGPSLVHRLLAVPVALKDAPLNGGFTAVTVVGVKPLFKMETTAPYSTVNKTADGKYWSSKIATGLGSQAMPLDTLAALAALPPYTADTKVYSFGVGYANDKGNHALVTSITFGGSKFELKCFAPSASASASASAGPSASSSSAPATVETGNSLPLTGIKLWQIVVIAGALLSAGFLAIVLSRRRNKVRWQA